MIRFIVSLETSQPLISGARFVVACDWTNFDVPYLEDGKVSWDQLGALKHFLGAPPSQ